MNGPNRPAATSPHISCDGSATLCHIPENSRCKKTVNTCIQNQGRAVWYCRLDVIWQGNNNETQLLSYHWPGLIQYHWDREAVNPPTQRGLRWNTVHLILFVNSKGTLRFSGQGVEQHVQTHRVGSRRHSGWLLQKCVWAQHRSAQLVNDALWTVSMSCCNKTSQANMHTNIFSPLSCEFIPSLLQRLRHKKVLSLCIYTLCGAVDINNKHYQSLIQEQPPSVQLLPLLLC